MLYFYFILSFYFISCIPNYIRIYIQNYILFPNSHLLFNFCYTKVPIIEPASNTLRTDGK